MPRTVESPVRVPTTWEPGMEPAYSSEGASGADLRANIREPLELPPGRRVLVPTGVRCAIPSGLEGQVRPRSGLALKKGLTVANAPGTIDSDYRGEIRVILINLGTETVSIEHGERIAQLVIAPVARADFARVDPLPESGRGEGGFGSTGAR